MQRDGHIRLLPIHVANKIAAGEVVERPASVVKELIENSIDAGATRIDVTVTAGGRKLIEIRDNGCGMCRDDALLSIERQATSKIRDVDDIERIDTLGFRGEALPSIASVSRFTLKTRRAEADAGTELSIVGGTIQEVRDTGVPPGTDIEVRDLFFNVPARRKFLRAFQTEQAHIRSVFTLHALAHPALGFTLTADGRLLTRLLPDSKPEERIRDLFGADFCAALRPISHSAGTVKVWGFASLPNQTRTDASEQYIFVNGRPATAPVIAYALREAYPPLEGERKPIVILFIELPPEEVDVNVHPTKREVRFRQPAEVREAIIQAITAALTPTPAVPMPPPAPAPAGTEAAPAAKPFPYPAPPLPDLPPPPASRPIYPPRPQPAAGTGLPLFPAAPAPVPAGATVPPATAAGSAPWKWFRVMGQLANGYVLLETDGGFVTLYPRAARERVLYEQLIDSHSPAIPDWSQSLLLPETVQLPPADAERIRQHLPILQAMGFGIDTFEGDHFVVDSLPQILGTVPVRELIGNIAHDLESAGAKRGSEKWREEIIAEAACRTVSALMTDLAPQAITRLVNDLAATRMPYTCPRGRPTMIFTSTRELNRRFGL